MPSQRLAFVLLLTINAVLFAKSRYGQVGETSALHGEESLVKRISYELLNVADDADVVRCGIL